MTKSTWNTERMDFLRLFWGKMTAAAIASELGHGITRNSVIAKCHRMGLHLPEEKRLDQVKGFEKVNADRLAKKIVRDKWEKVPPNESTGITMYELTENTCRYPQGDPLKPDFNFCGKRVCRNGYCSHHFSICHQADQRAMKFKLYEKELPEPLVELDGVR